jgi:23S rRNA pseudouridine1911/1915/1917 synthase
MPDIIYEDNHIIVVIKPQNVPTQADESGDPDLLNEIKAYIKQSAGKTGEAFVGLVHRLDRVTGGVMVFAKTSKAAARLSAQLQDGRFQKKYLAVVLGEPKHRSGELTDYLLKNPKTNVVEVVPAATGDAKRAELTYKLLNTSKQVSLVEICLLTGRSHQARVQMAHLGHTVFGDAKYGGDKLAKGWNLALWAYELKFEHPTTRDTLKFVVNRPETPPWDRFDFQRGRDKK